jgi:hypothetical protein
MVKDTQKTVPVDGFLLERFCIHVRAPISQHRES